MADIEPAGWRELKDGAFKQAEAAAASGDPVGAVEALHNSAFLGGLIRTMKARWGRLSIEEVEDAVAEAVQSFYSSVREGRKVSDIGAYLWKASHNESEKHYEKRLREQAKGRELEQFYGGTSPSAYEESFLEYAEVEEQDLAERRVKAIATARRLLPQLGQENLQAVMSYVIDALEAEQLDFTNAEMAEAVGLTVDNAKKCKSRALQRLTRIAQEEGLLEGDFGIAELTPGELGHGDD